MVAIAEQSGDRTTGLLRAGNRSADELAFDEAVVSYFIDAAEMLGVPKSVAAIYGICFASPEPLGFGEIQERLDISAGSISQGLRVLKEVGALKVAESGRPVERCNGGVADGVAEGDLNSRSVGSNPQIDRSAVHQALARQRDRYEPDLELRKLVLRWLETRLYAQLRSGSSRLERLMRSIPANCDATTLRERVGALQTWHDKSHALMPVVKTFLKLT